MGVEPSEFFKERQGAAVLKHGILRRYLAVFTGKLGSTSADNKVFFLDAYAGPGEYEGGGEGSPAIARATAELLARNRNLVGIYVEADKDNLARLEKFLESSEHSHHILSGEIEDNLSKVFELVGHAPLLAFFDPFGLTVPIERLQALMKRQPRPNWPYPPPTELIIHVSYTGIARKCGLLTSEKANPKARETAIRNTNAQLGGDWWQEIATKRDDGWVEAIAFGYAKRLNDLTGAGWFRVPVRDKPGGRVAYELLLVSNYTREAHWIFHEQVSLANEEWRKFNAANAVQAELPVDESTWIASIKANIVELLKHSDFKVRDKWKDVYGPATFGLARGMHVRKAIKELFEEEVTLCNGKKQGKVDLPDLVVTRGPKAPPLAKPR